MVKDNIMKTNTGMVMKKSIIILKSLKNTTRKKNVITMATVDYIHVVTEDLEYVFVVREPMGNTQIAVGVNAKEKKREYVMQKQGNVPAATTKKQAGERDV